MDTSERMWLVGAGVLSASIAAVHVGIIVAGPRAYVYFGAGDLAPMAAAGSPIPALLTGGIALLFVVWTWYAFAGAGLVRRPPLLWLGLWVIGGIYTARGLAIVPELLAIWRGSTSTPPRYAVFSLVALTAGLAHLVGAWRARARRRADGGASSGAHTP